MNDIELLKIKYEILSTGRIINKISGKDVVFPLDHKGYPKTRLYTPLSNHKDGRKPYRLHRIIAMEFLVDFNEELTVNHKDGNKENNNVSNLEMMTNKENMEHAYKVLGRTNEHLSRNEKGQFIKNNQFYNDKK